MPSLNEFFDKKEEIAIPVNVEKIDGVKPCASCELDASESWWDPDKRLLFWTCPNNHKNEYKVN